MRSRKSDVSICLTFPVDRQTPLPELLQRCQGADVEFCDGFPWGPKEREGSRTWEDIDVVELVSMAGPETITVVCHQAVPLERAVDPPRPRPKGTTELTFRELLAFGLANRHLIDSKFVLEFFCATDPHIRVTDRLSGTVFEPVIAMIEPETSSLHVEFSTNPNRLTHPMPDWYQLYRRLAPTMSDPSR